MDVHFEYLYSKCYTQQERNRLFWEMLVLLDDKSEKKVMRKRYYKIDKNFARTDRKKRRKRSIFRVKNFLKRTLLRLIGSTF